MLPSLTYGDALWWAVTAHKIYGAGEDGGQLNGIGLVRGVWFGIPLSYVGLICGAFPAYLFVRRRRRSAERVSDFPVGEKIEAT